MRQPATAMSNRQRRRSTTVMIVGTGIVRRSGWVDIEATAMIAPNTGGIIHNIRRVVTQGAAVTKAGTTTHGTTGIDGTNTGTSISATDTNIIISVMVDIGITGTARGKAITTITTDLRERA